jgi:hypothetical protein
MLDKIAFEKKKKIGHICRTEVNLEENQPSISSSF